MIQITKDLIQNYIADNRLIYQRGQRIFNAGDYARNEFEPGKGHFLYDVEGNYGNYSVMIKTHGEQLITSCDCPYPGPGCKHIVAVAMDIESLQNGGEKIISKPLPISCEEYLSEDEIRIQAFEDREKRSKSENLDLQMGEMFKDEHIVKNLKGKQYTVTLHQPGQRRGHCTCPDFATNGLHICKHIIFVDDELKKKKNFHAQVEKELFPFIDIYWDSERKQPRMFNERPMDEIFDIHPLLYKYFDENGFYIRHITTDILDLFSQYSGDRRIRFQEELLQQLNYTYYNRHLKNISRNATSFSFDAIKATLYPYQQEGVKFGLYKQAVLIGDEMGLGKTLQAISLGILKKKEFDFQKILVITLASLKEQWKREIERFTDEQAAVISGNKEQRGYTYQTDHSLFKITNYEAVLRDITFIQNFSPDIIILDEAQRIKNFETKTAEAVKSLPKKHGIVLTGTPLENKLEDVYSIVQFLDPYLLTPLWRFAADHFMISKEKKGKIIGYQNLHSLKKKLESIVIRRKKKEVLSELPSEVINNYYVQLTEEQQHIHAGYSSTLVRLLNKKFLTPIDMRRIQETLLKMRQVCDSTYLIDKETNLSPKLKELENILDELVIQNNRKVVIFSEWTTMTYLIGKHLSNAGIKFVELSGKIPVRKRQPLIDEFTHNPECKVFLSTDAGGTGLNLQASDCVINFELPWNPSRLNQRIGRVSRIGQKSGCVNVINLIAKNSLEERILVGLKAKTDVFEGVFDKGGDVVEFSREKKEEMFNSIRKMLDQDSIESKPQPVLPEDLPEDTPHYLNPEVLTQKKDLNQEGYDTKELENIHLAEEKQPVENASDILQSQPPERVEEVLNNGLKFIGGLMEMATGQTISATGHTDKMIHIDKETGEVTMKFKLPGF